MFDSKKSLWIFFPLLIAGLCGADWFVCGFICTLWSLLLLFFRLGKCIPVLEIPMFLAGIQWVVAPYCIYHMDDVNYVMLLKQDYYAAIAVPAYLLFCSGIELCNKKIILPEEFDSEALEVAGESKSIQELDFAKFIYLLLGVSLTGTVLSFTFFAVGSFTVMLASMSIVAVISSFFCRGKWLHWLLPSGYILYLLQVCTTGMFHDFLISGYWLMVFFLFKIKAQKKIVLLCFCCGLSVACIAQGVKWNYRNSVNIYDRSASISSLLSEVTDWVRNASFSSVNNADFVVRFNQGWHISQVILHMDATGKYLNGSSIADSIVSILLPRYLLPNKRKGGGRENFATMTSHTLVGGTSMNVCYVGEGYGNWGKCGAYFFPFVVGILLGLAVRLTDYIGKTYREIYYFIPVLFYFAVKVEGDFFMTFNQYVKTTLIAMGIILWYRKSQRHSSQKQKEFP